jgi:hypothetical protein
MAKPMGLDASEHDAERLRPPASESACRCAAAFYARDPTASLARLGITLVARASALWLPAKLVHGIWDPLLRRIELHGCNQDTTDEDLVHTLGHELGHALRPRTARCSLAAAGPGQGGFTDGEPWATAFGRAWVSTLGPNDVHVCAAALREQAARGERGTRTPMAGISESRSGVGMVGNPLNIGS